ncbi:hypothetical protein QUA71_18545 [Microcoleus sp. MON1_C5]|uniref:hypothetical protein n=1 Tax=Microcoleus sp. MON1_C5 TaxID=2818828 RepID=UPI002FD1A63C
MKSKFSRFIALCLLVVFGLILYVPSPAFADTRASLENNSVLGFTSGQPILAGFFNRIRQMLDDTIPRIEGPVNPGDFSAGQPSLPEVIINMSKPVPANTDQPSPGQSIQNFQREKAEREIDRATGGKNVDRNNSAGEKVKSGATKNVA